MKDFKFSIILKKKNILHQNKKIYGICKIIRLSFSTMLPKFIIIISTELCKLSEKLPAGVQSQREMKVKCTFVHLQKQPLAPRELTNHFRQKMCGYSWLFSCFSDDTSGSEFHELLLIGVWTWCILRSPLQSAASFYSCSTNFPFG